MKRALVIGVLVAAVAGASASACLADALRLESTPQTPEVNSEWALTASGAISEEDAAATLEMGVVSNDSNPSSCSSGPQVFGSSLIQRPIGLGSFETNEAGERLFNFTYEEHAYGPELVCAYLVTDNRITTSATLTTTATPSLDQRNEAAARSNAVTHLSVKVVNHPGISLRVPGYATLYVTTSPYAYVAVHLTRFGRRTERFEWGSTTTGPASVIHWSCKRPGGTYRYEVTARTNVGDTLVRRGRFAAISVARCHAIGRREAEARNRSAQVYGERIQRETREAREKLEQWENNCHALGGSTVTIQTGEGSERACRSPRGGLLPVPI